MSTLHTPGPWSVFSNRFRQTLGMNAVTHIFGANGGSALFSHYYAIDDENKPYENWDEVDANARLIAAAPELLEALKSARWMLTRDYIDPQKMEIIEKVNSALEKAEGNHD